MKEIYLNESKISLFNFPNLNVKKKKNQENYNAWEIRKEENLQKKKSENRATASMKITRFDLRNVPILRKQITERGMKAGRKWQSFLPIRIKRVCY